MKKLWCLGLLAAAALLGSWACGASSDTTSTVDNTYSSAIPYNTGPSVSVQDKPVAGPATQAYAPAKDYPTPDSSTQTDSGDQLSNDDTYTNVDGDTVHSPAYSENGEVPADATAQCNDGTYSFSENHRGTCSHHGGVAVWLR